MMNVWYKQLCSIIVVCILVINNSCSDEYSKTHYVEVLWGAPGTVGRSNNESISNNRIFNVYQPTLSIHLPESEISTRTAVVICPGGGYNHITIIKEGYEVAKWFNSIGVAAFVLKYRLSSDEALQDVRRAIQTVRYGAFRWNIDPDQIGIIGFSAGGHLAGNLCFNSKKINSDSTDAIDGESYLPNFMILAYASTGGFVRDSLITSDIPPTFLVHAKDDKSSSFQDSEKLYSLLQKFKIPSFMLLFEKGGHGFGLGKRIKNVRSWPDSCKKWLQELNLLEKPQ